MSGRRAAALLGLSLSLYQAGARGEEREAAASEVSGSLRLDGWSSTRTLDDRRGVTTLSLWMKGGAPLGRHLAVYAEGWTGYPHLGRERAVSGMLREAYVDLSLGPLAVRAGKQILVWGRADAINPTDNLSPRDFTLLVPEDDDQRFGAAAVKAALYVGSMSLTAVWLPDFEPYVVPIPSFPPGVMARESRPSAARSLTEGAVRVEQTGLAVDWSLSYFDGYDRVPNLGVDATATPAAPVTTFIGLFHPRIRVVGADAATVVGRYGLRAEAAYTFTADERGDEPQIRNPFLRAVLGGDRTFQEYLNLNVQYVLQVVTRFHSPLDVADPALREVAVQGALASNQWDRVQHGGTLRVSDKWMNETLEAELSAAVFGPTASYLVRGKVSYAISDRWRAIAGFNWFDGVEPSPLRFLRKNSALFAEMRLAF